MKKIDISNIISDSLSSSDEWLSYIIPRLDFFTDNLGEPQLAPAYCFQEHGKGCVFIANQYLKPGKAILEIIKHEVAHLYFGHLKHMKGSNAEKQLKNILFDCSIHHNSADPVVISETVGDVCTYESCGLKILPPLVLFDKMKPKVKQMEMFFKENLNDVLWKQKAPSDVEQQVISNAIEQGIDEAIKDGKLVPASMPKLGGTGHHDSEREYTLEKVKSPKWLKKLRKYISDTVTKDKNLTWRREPRNMIASNILKKGYGPTKGRGRCLFAIDCSYSMDMSEIERCISVLIQCTSNEGIEGEVLFFDTSITNRVSLKNTEKVLELASRMGGGTAYKPVFDYARPDDILVFYTDGYPNDGASAWATDKLNHKPIFVLCDSHIHEHYLTLLNKVGITIPIDKEEDWSEPI